MQDYLMYMVILLIIPALISQYIYPIQRLLDKPEPGDRNRSGLVWLVFAFGAWMVDGNFDNKTAKWDLCRDLGRYVSESKMPDACFEKYYADD